MVNAQLVHLLGMQAIYCLHLISQIEIQYAQNILWLFAWSLMKIFRYFHHFGSLGCLSLLNDWKTPKAAPTYEDAKNSLLWSDFLE